MPLRAGLPHRGGALCPVQHQQFDGAEASHPRECPGGWFLRDQRPLGFATREQRTKGVTGRRDGEGRPVDASHKRRAEGF